MREETSLISMHPFFRYFVLGVVNTIKEKKYGGEKFIIHADMVPKVSENVMMASMGPALVPPRPKRVERQLPPRMDMSQLAAPIKKPVRRMPQQIQQPQVLPPRPRPIPVTKPDVEPATKQPSGPIQEGYGKIIPLLRDPSVSTIECQGKGKEILVTRAGQKQRTRIALADEEILNILEKVADEAHIPLIDGVFRASLEEFSISAVISKVVGSKFVIKKITAYDILR